MMNPSVPSTSLAKVPGPDHTLKFLRISGSVISTGVWSRALVTVILVVAPLADRTLVAPNTTTSTANPSFTIPACTKPGYRKACQFRPVLSPSRGSIDLPDTAAFQALEEHEIRRAHRCPDVLIGSVTLRARWIRLPGPPSSIKGRSSS